MDEDYNSYNYDDYYCDTPTYSAFDDIFTDALFEPFFHSSDHHIDVPTQATEFDIFIAGEHENEAEGRTVHEDVHVGGPVTLQWGNQDDDDDDDDESLSLGRLLRDGIAALLERLEQAEMPSSLNWNWKSWGLLRGRDTQINVTSGGNSGEVEGVGVDKGKELVRSETAAASCSICMEHWTSHGEHSVCSLPCGHLYGMSCIKRWLQEQNQGKCPQCKKICKLEEVRKLYGPFVVADKNLEEKIRLLEAKCASLELKDSEWEKKEAEWRRKEADFSRKIANKEKVDDLRDVAEVRA